MPAPPRHPCWPLSGSHPRNSCHLRVLSQPLETMAPISGTCPVSQALTTLGTASPKDPTPTPSSSASAKSPLIIFPGHSGSECLGDCAAQALGGPGPGPGKAPSSRG